MICVGLDIGSLSVKLAEIQASSKSYSITRYHEFPLSTDPHQDKKIDILDALRKIAESYDPHTTRFIIAVPQQHVVLRSRQFPFKERYKILRSIAFELEDDIPFSQEDAIFDAKITRFVDNSADVIASACPKIYLKDLVQLVREAGIEPEIVSIEGLALGNLLEDWQEPPPTRPAMGETPEPRAAQLVLNIGHTRTTFVAVSEKSLITARHIDWGGQQIAEAISNKYNLHYLEALKDLQKKSFILPHAEGATKDQIIFSDLIKASFEPLIQDVRFSLIEMMANNSFQFKNIYLCGGTSQIKGLAPFLTQKWDVAVQRFKHLSLHPHTSLEGSSAEEAQSATAIGIALEGLKRPRNPASNLLKDEFAKQAETFKIFWNKWSYAAQLLGVAFLILLIYSFVKESLSVSMTEKALEVLKSQAGVVADLKGSQASVSHIRKFVQQKKAEIGARKLALQVKNLNSPLDILALVHQISPGPKQMLVEIRHLSIENDLLELHGEVTKPEAAQRLRQALQNVAIDNKVEPLATTAPTEPGKQPFGFRLKVDRHRGG